MVSAGVEMGVGRSLQRRDRDQSGLLLSLVRSMCQLVERMVNRVLDHLLEMQGGRSLSETRPVS